MTTATPPKSIGAMVLRYKSEFAMVLPSSFPVDMFTRLAESKLRTDAKLRDAAIRNPESLFAALMECARLGHEPGTNEFALVPWPDKNAPNGVLVLGIEQYQGLVERMLNSGMVVSVRCEVVRWNDYFDPRKDQPFTPPDHRPAWYNSDPPGQTRHPWLVPRESRGELTGVYAYAVMESGVISQVVTMPRDEVMLHKAKAKTLKFWEGDWEEAMWRKTAIHALADLVPTSAEQAWRRAERSRDRLTSPPGGPMPPESDSPVSGHPDRDDVVDAQVVGENT